MSVSLIIEDFAGLNQHIHLKPDCQRVPVTSNEPDIHNIGDIFDDDEIEMAINEMGVTPPAKRTMEELITPKSLHNSPAKKLKENFRPIREIHDSPTKRTPSMDATISLTCKHQCKDKSRFISIILLDNNFLDASTNAARARQKMNCHKLNRDHRLLSHLFMPSKSQNPPLNH